MQTNKHTLRRPARSHLPPGMRLERWQRWAIYGSIGLLSVSGMVWIYAHFFLHSTTQFGETGNALEPWSMKLHGAAAMVTLFFIGSLLNGHIRRALRAGRNRLTGWGMIGMLGFLTVSGFGLYYLASENSRPIWSALHWGVGSALVFGLAAHIVQGRRTTR